MHMAALLKLQVTLVRRGMIDHYHPTFEPVTVLPGDVIYFDDDWDELVVKVPSGYTARIRMSKAEMETFTEYI